MRYSNRMIFGLLPGVAARKLTAAWVFSPTPERRAAFAVKLGRELEIPLDVAESAEEALESADVLITATNAPTPVLTASV